MTQYYYIVLMTFTFVVTIPWIFMRPVHYYTIVPLIFFSTVPVSIVYLILDVYFTRLGVWGFNATYHLPYTFFSLPIEEYLFFFIIPYSSLFIYRIISHHFRRNRYIRLLRHLSPVFIGISCILLLVEQNRMYTVLVCILVLISVTINYSRRKTHWLGVFYFSYLIIFIPFVAVNGVLTGLITDFPIVFYSSLEFSGIRLLTIPLEDIAYGFSYLLFIVTIFEILVGRKNVRRSHYKSIAY